MINDMVTDTSKPVMVITDHNSFFFATYEEGHAAASYLTSHHGGYSEVILNNVRTKLITEFDTFADIL